MNKIRAVVKLPGMKAAVVQIFPTNMKMISLVGGMTEETRLFEDAVIVSNRNYKAAGLKRNVKFLGKAFYGPMVFVGKQGEQYISLSEDAAQAVLELLNKK